MIGGDLKAAKNEPRGYLQEEHSRQREQWLCVGAACPVRERQGYSSAAGSVGEEDLMC